MAKFEFVLRELSVWENGNGELCQDFLVTPFGENNLSLGEYAKITLRFTNAGIVCNKIDICENSKLLASGECMRLIAHHVNTEYEGETVIFALH